jgi:hypothetical protein
MSDDTRLLIAIVLILLGWGFNLGLEIYVRFSRYAPSLHLLRILATLMAIGGSLIAIWLLLSTDRIRLARGLQSNTAHQRFSSDIDCRIVCGSRDLT